MLGIRPRDIAVVDPGIADVLARVESVQALGSEVLMQFCLPSGTALVMVSAHALRVGAQVGLAFRRDLLHVFDVATGDRVKLNTSSLESVHTT
jgi:hypothetical protein